MQGNLMFPKLVWITVVTLASVVQLNAATPAPSPGDEEDTGYSQISIFAKAVQLLRQDYVDGNKTSYHELITAAMKGLLASPERPDGFWAEAEAWGDE